VATRVRPLRRGSMTPSHAISEAPIPNPFEGKPSLAATLLCTLTCCLKNSGISSIQEIKKLRSKIDITDDIKTLEKEGYLVIDKATNQVQLTPLIGYKLDLHKLLVKLSLKLEE